MQRVGVLIFMVSMGLSLNAQFSVTPTDSLTDTVNVDAIYSIHKIDIINESDGQSGFNVKVDR